ncbi:hypothetical protein CFAM422_010123 [Trichoderma lentiforme]|uniref:MACPF-like domain-containing protein n=1 Tax=Trichoderma lentiforme TaxID=1567552 RepID=A0A9P5CB75_9HYPO|nr:hypothetical protein CFAM422_010123 [Trichoderma lentiforme]
MATSSIDMGRITVYMVDESSEKAKATNHVPIQGEDVMKTPLSGIRRVLSDGGLNSSQLSRPFCTEEGAQISDNTVFANYIKLTADKSQESSETDKVYKVYLKAKKATDISDFVKDRMAKELDLDLTKNKPELLKTQIQELVSSYSPAAYTAIVGNWCARTKLYSEPADMSEKHWSVVLRNNSILNGHRIVFSGENSPNKPEKVKFRRIERAPYTGNLRTASNLKQYRIPRYMISDDSYIDVFETQSSLSTAIAKSSFSQTEVEASVSGGAFGISAGVSAGFSQNESAAVSKSTSESTKSMNVSYNFPRVVLHLDAESVTLSNDCKTHIEQLKQSNSVDKLIDFHKKYGHFFATRIELGGRLYSSQESSSIGGADATENATAMKAAASLAISSSFVQASASASHEKQKADNDATNTNKFKASISWEAQGGNTLLCNNPAAWCSTVASYYNWRVIKQEGVEALGAFIGKIPGFSEVPSLFEQIEEQTRRKETVTFQLQSSNANESGKYLIMSKEGNFRIGLANSLPPQRKQAAFKR